MERNYSLFVSLSWVEKIALVSHTERSTNFTCCSVYIPWTGKAGLIFCSEKVYKLHLLLRGRILGLNTDKSLKSFPPRYSKSPLQLYLEISISSNSCNVLQFQQFRYSTSTVKVKGGKPDRKPYPTLPCSLRNPYITFKIMPRNLNEIVRSWIGLLFTLDRRDCKFKGLSLPLQTLP